jgi:type IV secretion system T-DNA border endonuclease VirD2
MARAATGARPAVFKAIRNGGTHNRIQLARQLTYVATKSIYVFDARGEYDGQRVLTPSQIAEATERFAQTWDKARPTKLGHTSHLLLSFPLGTKAETVRDVTRGVVEQFFQGQGAHFDYIVAVHDDRAHKHAHVILNRHSHDGEMFYLRSGHRFSYELFREAMVEHGDAYGLRLEATRRIDRGLVTYDARSVEVQQARVVGVELIERERVGPDLELARRHIALASLTYRGLAGAASHEGFHHVSEALLRASLTLANNGVVLPTREIEMADTQGSFDGLVREFGRNVQALEERIASAPPAQRPRLERGLTEALSSVVSLNPLGENSASLTQAPSTFGVYSQARIEREELDRLDDPRVSAAVDAAVQGTGLTASEVLARMRVGADSAALEDHWHYSDVQAVGARLGLDTARPEAKERVLDRLEDAYSRIETTLEGVGVLREARVEGDERERAEEVAAQVVAFQPRRVQQVDEGAAPLVDEASANARRRSLDDIRARLQATLDRQAAAPASPEVARDPLVDATVERLRDQAPAEYAFDGDDAAQAQPFRAALERQLGPDELARLRQGDESALSRVSDDRLDRLALAKAYLESDSRTRNTAAHYSVLDQIVDEQVNEHRLAEGHEEDGHTHG